MTLKQLESIRTEWAKETIKYKRVYWEDYDYTILTKILWEKRKGKNSFTFNNVIIGADTETSKKVNSEHNHIVLWTITLRAFNMNLVTLYGTKPSHFPLCLSRIIDNLNGDKTFIYFHNLSYDWVFLRKFLMSEFGTPINQLNTKSHYPINIEFANGLIIRDSLMLAQRSLEKWAKDMNVEHQKAVGLWDYDKLRNQDYNFSSDELQYAEFDTVALVECIDALRKQLNKRLYAMPYTATGIPREEVRKIGKEYHAHDKFIKQALKYEQYNMAESVYHGGYTHANRFLINDLLTDVKAYDFASSYPFVMISEKFPSESFTHISDKPIDYILRNMEEYAFMFKLILIKPQLKNGFEPMPVLQFSKCIKSINVVLDNGRILEADYVEIYITEMDLALISEQYKFEAHICTEIQVSKKEYLPRWFTDYVYQCFRDKTLLKGGDPVAYALAKAKVNSLYGMCVQKNIKDTINENYIDGEYYIESVDRELVYNKYLKKYNTVLPYQWGVWVTAYAMYNLFQLGKCCETWVYSDTDSCYGLGWSINDLEYFNNKCKLKLKANGYGAIIYNGRAYWLGIAEFDGAYSEFKVQGAKRYAGRDAESGDLKITVAGVPKKTGALVLNDDINNFRKGLIFPGAITGKLTHTYHFIEDIYIDENGNETGDSINLTPCDYLLDSVVKVDFEALNIEELEVPVYDEMQY